MNRSDEQRIEKIINGRQRPMRQEAKKRAAQLKAEVEDQLNSAYHFDDEQIWADAMAKAKSAIDEAQQVVAEHCRPDPDLYNVIKLPDGLLSEERA